MQYSLHIRPLCDIVYFKRVSGSAVPVSYTHLLARVERKARAVEAVGIDKINVGPVHHERRDRAGHVAKRRAVDVGTCLLYTSRCV